MAPYLHPHDGWTITDSKGKAVGGASIYDYDTDAGGACRCLEASDVGDGNYLVSYVKLDRYHGPPDRGCWPLTKRNGVVQ